MTGELNGNDCCSIFLQKLGPQVEPKCFFSGRQGFMAKLNLKYDPEGQFQLGTFDASTPKEQTVFRFSRTTGSLVLAFEIHEDGSVKYLCSPKSPAGERSAAEALAKEAMEQFANSSERTTSEGQWNQPDFPFGPN